MAVKQRDTEFFGQRIVHVRVAVGGFWYLAWRVLCPSYLCEGNVHCSNACFVALVGAWSRFASGSVLPYLEKYSTCRHGPCG